MPNINTDSINQLLDILNSDKFRRSLEQWKEKQKTQDKTCNDSKTAVETVMIDKVKEPQAINEIINEIVSDSHKLDAKECFNKYG